VGRQTTGFMGNFERLTYDRNVRHAIEVVRCKCRLVSYSLVNSAD